MTEEAWAGRSRGRAWLMRAVRSLALASVTTLALSVGGCVVETDLPGPGASVSYPLPPPPTVHGPVPTASVTTTLPTLEPLPTPARPYPVAKRELDLTNGDRPLRTLALFPSGAFVDRAFDVAPGRFPLVLFSHGLHGDPALYETHLRSLAAAGFIVVAPTYPGTSLGAEAYDPLDVLNQPADASAVLTAVLDLAEDPADRLFEHIDPDRIAAMGHSAGGYTTVGLLTSDRDERIRSAVVIAGSGLSDDFGGAPAAVLFVHGEADTVVPYSYGRTTYAQVPWPKAFLTVVDGGHDDLLSTGSAAGPAVVATVLDFLRATLYGDAEALARIPSDATVDQTTRFESTMIFPAMSTSTATTTPTATSTASTSATPSAEIHP